QLSRKKLINQWIHLKGQVKGKFKVILSGRPKGLDAEQIFGNSKFDHQIINAALMLMEENPGKQVVLVSKDICLRLKAKALNLAAEDYETGKIKNVDALYTGKTTAKHIPEALIDTLKHKTAVPADSLPLDHPGANQFYSLMPGRQKVN